MRAQDIDAWPGLDAGKQSQHACALDRNARTHRRQAARTGRSADPRTAPHAWASTATCRLPRDRPDTIDSLPLTAARRMGVAVGHPPGSAMRKAAQLPTGDAKTDEHDTYVIAFTAPHMPDTLRDAGSDDETMAALKVPAGLDNPRAIMSAHGRQWTHLPPRRAYFRLERLLRNRSPLCFLDPTLTVRGPMPRDSNQPESVLNAKLKLTLLSVSFPCHTCDAPANGTTT